MRKIFLFTIGLIVNCSSVYSMEQESKSSIVSTILQPSSLSLDEKSQLVESYTEKSNLTRNEKEVLSFIQKWYLDKKLLNSCDVCEKSTQNRLLHKAIQLKCIPVFSFLCENKISINTQNKELNTPLHYAFRYDRPQLVPVLLKYGARVEVQDDQGWTPLHCAVDKHLGKELALLVKKVKEQKDLNKKTKQTGLTPLHLACRREYTQIAQLLLEAKADPDIESNDFQTPLSEAKSSKNQALIALLKKHGATKESILEDYFTLEDHFI